MGADALYLIDRFAILGLLGCALVVIALAIDMLPEPN